MCFVYGKASATTGVHVTCTRARRYWWRSTPVGFQSIHLSSVAYPGSGDIPPTPCCRRHLTSACRFLRQTASVSCRVCLGAATIHVQVRGGNGFGKRPKTWCRSVEPV